MSSGILGITYCFVARLPPLLDNSALMLFIFLQTRMYLIYPCIALLTDTASPRRLCRAMYFNMFFLALEAIPKEASNTM